MKNLKYFLYFVIILFVSLSILIPVADGDGGIALFAIRKLDLKRRINERKFLKMKLMDKKYALILAVSDYDNVPKLNNTLNDARDVGEALESIGFNVRLVLDQDKDVVDKNISEYLEILKSNEASEGVIYIAGHGGQVNGRNYFFCKNALNTNNDIVNIHDVWKKMQNTGGLFRMMVLDICRTNPFYFQETQVIKSGKMKKVIFGENSRGVSPMTIDNNLTSNAIILYSTDEESDAVDGSGRNSPFAESFISWIKKTIDIFSVVNSITREVREKTQGRQIPYMYSSLTQGYILNRSDSLLVKKRMSDLDKQIKVIESELKKIEASENQAINTAAPKFVEP